MLRQREKQRERDMGMGKEEKGVSGFAKLVQYIKFKVLIQNGQLANGQNRYIPMSECIFSQT